MLATAGGLARDFFPRLRGGRVPGQSSRFCRRRSRSDGLGVLENRGIGSVEVVGWYAGLSAS